MNENQNFFDTRTIVSLVIVAAGFIGWEFHMRQKYPDYYNKKDGAVQSQSATEAKPENTQALPTAATDDSKASPKAAPAAPAEEKIISVDTPNLAFELSSQGMSLKNFKIKRYTDRKGQTVEIGHAEMSASPLETRLIGHAEPLNFSLEKINDKMYVGRAKVGNLQITKTVEMDFEKYLFHFKIATQGSDSRFVGLTTSLTDEVENVGHASLLSPQFEQQEFFVQSKGSKDRESFGKDDLDKSWSGVKIAAVGSQYFTQAVIDNSQVIPDAKGILKHESKAAEIVLQYPVLNQGQNFQLEYDAYVGPKSHQTLTEISPDLAQVVNFGYFSWIAQYILVMLKGFYSLVGNWGMAIVLLTVVVRALVLPINLYSYKSMKSMQAIQPQIQALKERYKDDQQKQQAEVMKLMRENKVNPVGGCLPMLLQFPIFIALYQVLGHSIELYQAPFVFWIHDLSIKDPYYILPVLMGVTMFFQQKLSPTPSMDPTQAKLMLMMPLIFTFFMVSLPSGLTLYMFVGAVFGVIQQLYFLRSSVPLASRGN